MYAYHTPALRSRTVGLSNRCSLSCNNHGFTSRDCCAMHQLDEVHTKDVRHALVKSQQQQCACRSTKMLSHLYEDHLLCPSLSDPAKASICWACILTALGARRGWERTCRAKPFSARMPTVSHMMAGRLGADSRVDADGTSIKASALEPTAKTPTLPNAGRGRHASAGIACARTGLQLATKTSPSFPLPDLDPTQPTGLMQ